MKQLQQSTTLQHILIGPMIDSADHISPKTGLTLTVTISKNAGSFASPSGAVTEIGNGWYKLAANATDNNTLGFLAIHATASGADPWDDLYDVVGCNFQDQNLRSSVRDWKGSTPNDLVSGLLQSTPSIVARSNVIQSASGLNIVLDASASATDQKYRYMWIYMLTGNAAGECDQIFSYAGSSKTGTLTKGWVNAPTTGDAYLISPYAPQAINWASVFGTGSTVNLSNTSTQTVSGLILANGIGVAAGGTSNTITLAASLGANGRAVGCPISVRGGTGLNQVRIITGYVNSTRVATVDRAWDDIPDTSTDYRILNTQCVPTDSSGRVLLQPTQTGVTIPTVSTLTGHTPQTGDTYALATDGTNGLAALRALLVTGNSQTVPSAIRSAIGMSVANLDSQLATIAASANDAATRTLAIAIRAALGMTAADLDTQLDAILAASPSVEAIADALFVDGSDNKLKVNADNTIDVDLESAVFAVTITSEQAAAAQVPGQMLGYTFNTLRAAPTALGNVTGRQNLWLCCKANLSDPDSAALFMIEESAGLLFANGQAVTEITPTLGVINVTNETTGAWNFRVDQTVLAQLTASKDRLHGAHWEAKLKIADDTRIVGRGRLLLVQGVTQANG